MKLPTLYKKTKTGAIEEWQIECGNNSYTITHGQVDGAKQSKTNLVKGKNIGKANETSNEEQAGSEAKSRWKKQLDKGYSLDIKSLERILPAAMLAHDFKKYSHKITYPCFVQPKLDGVRCLSYLDESLEQVVLLSRQGKVYNIPHVQSAIEKLFDLDDSCLDGIVFDGEIYIHGETFQNLVSWVKKTQPNTLKLEYHIYDVIWNKPFSERFENLSELFDKYVDVNSPLKLVLTLECESDLDIFSSNGTFINSGYEGSIIRYGDKPYEAGFRSQHLLKLKEFIDGEFEIIGAEQDKHKPKECTFLLITEDGGEFRCKPEGSAGEREQMWSDFQEDASQFVGKFMTVRYFEMTTSTNSVPRFPVGVSIDRWSYE